VNLDNLAIAFHGLQANRLRSALTTLGILIGVGAVMMTIGFMAIRKITDIKV